MSTTPDMNVFIDFIIQYYRIVPMTVFTFGVIGNILVIITLSGRMLRKNPCTTYFLGLAITNLNNLIFGLLPNYLIDVHGIDVLTASLAFCRLRFFIVHCSLVLSSWFVLLAGVDRFCISSANANRRNFSSLKTAHRSVGLATIVCFILYAHIFGLFTIDHTPSGPVCYAQSGSYRTFYDLLFFATYSFTPSILMIIVGFATFYNTLRARRQTYPMTTTDMETNVAPTRIVKLRKRDRQFIKILLIQLIFIVLLTLPIAVQKLYATFTQNVPKSPNRLLIESFFANFVRTLTQISSALSFYLYILSGSVFRYEFCMFMSGMIGLVFGVNGRVHQRFKQITGLTTVFPGQQQAQQELQENIQNRRQTTNNNT